MEQIEAVIVSQARIDWWTPEHGKLLDAIEQVESGGDMNAVGDGGRSIGAFQIGRAYWTDACQETPILSEHEYYYVAVDREYAISVMIAYWNRYAPNYELDTLARIHNGGPRGHHKTATIPYWNKVQNELNKHD